MFERFTPDARIVIANAQRVAEQQHSPFIRRHHMLIALLDSAEANGVVQDAFDDAGVDRSGLRAKLLASLAATETPDDAAGSPAFTREAKKAIELSLREALTLGHNHIADYHLLLGILRDAEGALADVLEETGLSRAQAGNVVAQRVPAQRRGRRVSRSPGESVTRSRLGRRATDTLQAVLRRAYERSGRRNATTGDLLIALVETTGTHFHKLLADVQLPSKESLEAAAQRLIDDGTPDGADPLTVDQSTGAVTIRDPELLAEFNRIVAEGASAADALVQILRRRRD